MAAITPQRRNRMREHLNVMKRVPAVRRRTHELIEFLTDMCMAYDDMRKRIHEIHAEKDLIKGAGIEVEGELGTAKKEYEEIRLLNAGYQTQALEWARKEKDYLTSIKWKVQRSIMKARTLQDLFFRFTLFGRENAK